MVRLIRKHHLDDAGLEQCGFRSRHEMPLRLLLRLDICRDTKFEEIRQLLDKRSREKMNIGREKRNPIRGL
jgi:hypothetical protein